MKKMGDRVQEAYYKALGNTPPSKVRRYTMYMNPSDAQAYAADSGLSFDGLKHVFESVGNHIVEDESIPSGKIAFDFEK